MVEKKTNPFPGLRPFEEVETSLFFGRGKQVVQLVDRLRKTRFLAIVGASGCGKSSLIRAGLLPSLQGVADSPLLRGRIASESYEGMVNSEDVDWRMVTMRPGDSPTGSLAAALSQKGKVDDHWKEDQRSVYKSIVETTLRGSSKGLVKAVQEARLPGNARVLILVDQFEELFRFWSHRDGSSFGDESKAFVSLLLNGVREPDVPIYIVLTMRSGYLGYCMVFPGLPEAISESQYLVPRMSRNELLTSITGPPAAVKAKIAPRLAANLLNALGEDQDQLPILQHFLMRLWSRWIENRQDDGPLDFQHVKEGESIHDALGNHADQIYSRLKADKKQGVVKKIFRVLTETNSEGLGIRRPVSLAQLCAITRESMQDIKDVIEQFRAPGCCFLMPPEGTPLAGNTIIDISHESLMRTWGRLEEWIREEENSARYYKRYLDVAKGWERERKPVYLWGDSHDDRLDFALAWQRGNQPNAAWAALYTPDRDIVLADKNYQLVKDFIEESRKERKRKEEELRADKERKEQEKKRKYKLFVSCAVLGLLFLIGMFFEIQTRLHEREQSALEKKKLVQAILLRMLDVGDPLMQALVFLEKGKENEAAAKELYSSFAEEMIPLNVLSPSEDTENSEDIVKLAVSPEYSRVAVGTSGGSIHLWDLPGDSGSSEVKKRPSAGSVTGLVFTGGGKGLVSSYSLGALCYWPLVSDLPGTQPEHYIAMKTPVRSLAADPGGNAIVYGLYDAVRKGGIDMLPMSSGPPYFDFSNREKYFLDSPIFSVSFGVKDIAGGALDGGVYLLPVSAAEKKNGNPLPLFTLPKRNGLDPFISSVAQNDSGHIAIGREDGLMYMLAPEGDTSDLCISESTTDDCPFPTQGYNCTVVKPKRNYGVVNGVGFWGGKPYGGYADGNIRIWQCDESLKMYKPEMVLRGHRYPIMDIAIDSRIDRMFSADFKEVRVWDLNNSSGGRGVVSDMESTLSSGDSGDNGDNVEAIQEKVRRSTNACLTVSQRKKYLQEDSEQAMINEKKCRKNRLQKTSSE